MKLNANLEKILIFLIIVNFIVLCFPLFQFPPPQNLYPDSASHYKTIELMKQDIQNFSYNPGYRKGFHLMSLPLSFISIGYSMALIATIFVGLLIFYSFKLGLHLTKNKTTALLTALLIPSITIASDVGTIPSPVPQTIGLALGVIALHYFLKEDWKKTAIAIGLYSITHSSFSFFIGLMLFSSIFQLFKENKLDKLIVLGKSFLVVIILTLITILTTFTNSIPNFKFSPEIAILDSSISPLSLLHVTSPFGILLIGLIGLIFLRKKVLVETSFFTLLLWFILPIIFSQSYWLEIELFPSSRALIFMLFPLAFFSAYSISLIKRKELLAVISIIILLFSFFGHFYFYEELPKNDFKKVMKEEELELIDFLKKKSLDEIVLAETKHNEILTLSHKKNSSQRNYWLVITNKKIDILLDSHKIKYLLIEKEFYEDIELIQGVEKEFENNKYILLKVKKDIEFRKSDELADHALALTTFWKLRQGTISSQGTGFLKVTATNTQEEFCILVSDSFYVSFCPNKVDFSLSGKKETLIELFNSYEKNYFYNKAAHFIRTKEIIVNPDKIEFVAGGPYYITYSAFIYQWDNGSKYSKPNQLIAEILYKLKIIG